MDAAVAKLGRRSGHLLVVPSFRLLAVGVAVVQLALLAASDYDEAQAAGLYLLLRPPSAIKRPDRQMQREHPVQAPPPHGQSARHWYLFLYQESKADNALALARGFQAYGSLSGLPHPRIPHIPPFFVRNPIHPLDLGLCNPHTRLFMSATTQPSQCDEIHNAILLSVFIHVLVVF